jgi:orotidine-5'-phosphate decarboxylase
MTFLNKLRNCWDQNNSLVCVGLDPDLSKIPAFMRSGPKPIFSFLKEIVDSTADLVCCYKPQIAHFSAHRAESDLEEIIAYIHKQYPLVPVILDGKRGDIGSTAEMYAREMFDRYDADAATVNPYLGTDSLKPYVDRQERGVLILCRNSNPGARDLQDLPVEDGALFERVAKLSKDKWNYNENVLLVVGATVPAELKRVREIVGDMPILVPGIGAQGGSIESTVLSGKDSRGKGLILSSSREVLYSSQEKDFAKASRAVVIKMRDEANQFRA